jgi:hypothetical protein
MKYEELHGSTDALARRLPPLGGVPSEPSQSGLASKHLRQKVAVPSGLQFFILHTSYFIIHNS